MENGRLGLPNLYPPKTFQTYRTRFYLKFSPAHLMRRYDWTPKNIPSKHRENLRRYSTGSLGFQGRLLLNFQGYVNPSKSWGLHSLKATSRWFKVPSWRSLNHFKRSLNHPKNHTELPGFRVCFCCFISPAPVGSRVIKGFQVGKYSHPIRSIWGSFFLIWKKNTGDREGGEGRRSFDEMFWGVRGVTFAVTRWGPWWWML